MKFLNILKDKYVKECNKSFKERKLIKKSHKCENKYLKDETQA